ncbi:MAG: hypothetical protein Q7S01_02295 [bacterium]|nr:hypothetical protein [bacterium]
MITPNIKTLNNKSRRERTVQVLKMIAIGALIIGIGAVPSPRAMSKLLSELALGDNQRNRKYAGRKIRELKKRGYLEEHGVRYAVSDKGQEILSREHITNLVIPRPRKWNGKWHFIMFDIPLTDSYARQALNKILLGMGLVQYQQSVLIYPYPIKETVLHVCRFYKVARYVSFVTAEDIDGFDKLKRQFGLT